MGWAAHPGSPDQRSLRSLRRERKRTRPWRWATAKAARPATTTRATIVAGTRSVSGVPRAGGALWARIIIGIPNGYHV